MQHWNSYWKNTKTLNSFAEGEQRLGYTGPIADFWQTIFWGETAGAQVLDLATGNGALAVLALQTNDGFSVSASDAADISPLTLFSESDEVYPLLSQIKFFANMPSEKLEFNSGSFDLVVSQFGFEYAEPELALRQIYRVLKSGGRFAALVHHDSSFITRDCRHGIDMLQQFLKSDGVIRHAAEYIRLCETLASNKVLTNEQQDELKLQSDKLRHYLIQIQQRLTADQLDWFSFLAKDLITVFSDWRNANTAALALLSRSMMAYLRRLEDQIASAWSVQKAEDFMLLAKSDWQIQSLTPIVLDGEVLCWSLVLNKR
ncbi:class I SAM-dependent methyltransferase [Rheinheimera sp. FR7-31]|uniref:class I SAM-dependent methyltransferase n=1 Tax=Rheinheimera fenheensis TaxID=3152295 RepID=UPI00325E1B6C